MRAVLAAALLSLAATPAGAAHVAVFAGEPAERIGLTTADLVIHPMDDEFYTESWYLMSRLTDGRQLFLHYGITNAGPGSFMGAIESTVIDVDGKIHFDKTQVDKDDIKYATDALKVDYDGDHLVEGTPKRIVFRSKGEKIHFDLVFTPLAPGVVHGNGRTTFDDDGEDFYELRILSPRATVGGSLTVEGKSSTVEGLGYGDHAWQNYPPHKMADRLFSLRGFNGDDALSLLVFVAPGGKLIPSLVVARGDQIAAATHKIELAQSDFVQDEEIKSYKLPTKLAIRSVASAPNLLGQINFRKRVQRQDAVQDFNIFQRTLIKMFVAKPILYRYDAEYVIEWKGADGAVQRTEGSGIAEAMILRAD